MLWLIMALVLTWGSMLPAAAGAAVVGRLTAVEGQVDILKGGKLPATPVQVGAQLETGDVLRSKSLSKAQITLTDDSIITLSPQGRLAIDEYTFDAAQGKRQAVIELFQGLAHVVVNKLFTANEPDFVVKTHTAVTGVRGTDFGIRLQANSTTILNFSGVTQVANVFPEVGGLDRKINHVAFSFGPPGSANSVILHNMQGTFVAFGLPPTLPFGVTADDLKVFNNQLGGPLLKGQQGQGTGSGSGPISQSNLGGADSGLGTMFTSSPYSAATIPAIALAGLVTGTGSQGVTLLNTVTVPPTVGPSSGGGSTPTPTPTPGPTPSTFSFTQQYYSAFLSASNAPYNQSNLLVYSWGQRTGVYDGYFSATGDATRTAASGTTFASLSTGTAMGTATGTVTGLLGQTLTGNMTYSGTNSFGETINRTGAVTILPTGQLTYNWTDTVSLNGQLKATGVGTTTQTPGTLFTQTATGSATTTANLAGNQITSTNFGDLTGTRVENGITTSFKAGYSVTTTAPTAGTFTSGGGSVTIPSQGVLGAPDANGVRTGVMTYGTVGNPFSGGPVRDVPATGSSPAATFGTIIGDTSTISNTTTTGIWAQTPDPSAQIITQTYQGSTAITPPGGTTGTLNSTGWGLRTESGSPGPYTTGGITGTVTVTSGSTFNSNPDPFNYTVAAVVNGSATRTGPAQGVGLATNTLVSTTGTVVIDPAAVMTHNFTGTWISPDNRGTLTGGSQTMTPGTYFEQTTTNTASLSTPTTTPPTYQQTTTFSGPVAGTTIHSFTNTAGAFPAAGTVPNTIVNLQGVVIPGGTLPNGNLTMTTHQGTGPVSTYTSPVSITGSALNAANLVGRNVANPGVNRFPARQTGSVTTNLVP